MLEKIIQWLESHQAPCIYRKFLGIDCPGCGMQRAFIELLKGNLWESILLYPALIPMIIMFFFLPVHLILKFKQGGTLLKHMFIFNTAIILIHYIYKLIIHFSH